MAVVDFNEGPADYIRNLKEYRDQCARADLEAYLESSQFRHRNLTAARREKWIELQHARNAAKLDVDINTLYLARIASEEQQAPGRARVLKLLDRYHKAKAEADAFKLEG